MNRYRPGYLKKSSPCRTACQVTVDQPTMAMSPNKKLPMLVHVVILGRYFFRDCIFERVFDQSRHHNVELPRPLWPHPRLGAPPHECRG